MIVRGGAVAIALGAIATLLAQFDLMPAFSGDIKTLDRKQTNTAVEVYQNKVRSLLLLPEPEGPVRRRIWQEELNHARRQLEAAEDRKIELSD